MAGAASAHQAATATHEETSQQRAGRTRRTSADPQRAQQGATAAADAEPAALDRLSRLQRLADASPQVAQLRRLQARADGRFAPVAQLAGDPEEEELVQGKFASAELQPQLQQAPRANNTGLPDQLKSGIESLSGLSMDHVRVHYNSSQPAQLNALAYAQGSDIHLAPGQERHLPHEAWHVVQQAQGRVKPTTQMKEGVKVNDDAVLEREADVMGTKALEGGDHFDETGRSISRPIETAERIESDTTNSPDVKVAIDAELAETETAGAAPAQLTRAGLRPPPASPTRTVQMAGHAGVMIFGNGGRLLKRVEKNEYEQFTKVRQMQQKEEDSKYEDSDEKDSGDKNAGNTNPTRRGAFPRVYQTFPPQQFDANWVREKYGDSDKVKEWLAKRTDNDYYVEMESVGGENIDVLDFKIGTTTANAEELITNYEKTQKQAAEKVSRMDKADTTTETNWYGLRDSDAAKSWNWDNFKRMVLRKFVPTLTNIQARVKQDRDNGLGPYTDSSEAIKNLNNIYEYIKNADTVYIASSLVMQWHNERTERDQDRVVLIDLAHPVNKKMGGFSEAKEGMLLGILNLKNILLGNELQQRGAV
ncbi:MAG: inositol polyphosphate kinase family protein [Cyanobium sp.]